MHIGVADQGAKGPKEICSIGCLSTNLAVINKVACNGWPVTCSCPYEFGIQCGQRKQRTPSQIADAIKTLDFEETLTTAF